MADIDHDLVFIDRHAQDIFQRIVFQEIENVVCRLVTGQFYQPFLIDIVYDFPHVQMFILRLYNHPAMHIVVDETERYVQLLYHLHDGSHLFVSWRQAAVMHIGIAAQVFLAQLHLSPEFLDHLLIDDTFHRMFLLVDPLPFEIAVRRDKRRNF